MRNIKCNPCHIPPVRNYRQKAKTFQIVVIRGPRDPIRHIPWSTLIIAGLLLMLPVVIAAAKGSTKSGGSKGSKSSSTSNKWFPDFKCHKHLKYEENPNLYKLVIGGKFWNMLANIQCKIHTDLEEPCWRHCILKGLGFIDDVNLINTSMMSIVFLTIYFFRTPIWWPYSVFDLINQIYWSCIVYIREEIHLPCSSNPKYIQCIVDYLDCKIEI